MSQHYSREAVTKKLLEDNDFQIMENVKTGSGSRIDLIGTYRNCHLLFEFKQQKPISTIDVHRFQSMITDLDLPGEKEAFLVTNSFVTGSAKHLSERLNIQIIKADNEELPERLEEIAAKCKQNR